jgi:hypothetical protein
MACLKDRRTRSIADIGVESRTMTPDESGKLKPGKRVCFNGDLADRGTVMATNAKYVTIMWDDGHQSFTGHSEMNRVELVRK